MNASNNFLLGAAALVLAGCASEPRPPEAISKLADPQPLIVVAKLEAGESLPPQPSPPPKPGVVTISLDPPPFRVKVEVNQTVYGPQELPKVLNATTISHYGPQPMPPEPQLVFLRTDGRKYVIQRYGYTHLVRKPDGSLYLPVWGTRVAPWLPCAALDLREEIDRELVQQSIKMRDPDYAPAMQHPDLFRAEPGGFLPRYAIDLRKLASYLRSNPPPIDRVECN